MGTAYTMSPEKTGCEMRHAASEPAAGTSSQITVAVGQVDNLFTFAIAKP